MKVGLKGHIAVSGVDRAALLRWRQAVFTDTGGKIVLARSIWTFLSQFRSCSDLIYWTDAKSDSQLCRNEYTQRAEVSGHAAFVSPREAILVSSTATDFEGR